MIDLIQITKADYNDLDKIFEIQKLAFASEAELYNDNQIEPLTQKLESLQADFYNYTFLKAELEHNIIGSVKAREENGICWIGKLIVLPEFQNKGIGRKLMMEAEKYSLWQKNTFFLLEIKALKT